MQSRIAVCSICVTVLAGGALAQDPISSPAIVDTVDVVAPRPFPEERLGSLRGFVQVVPVDAVGPRSSDLGDLLDRVAGLQVRRYGGLGSFAVASVRGNGPSHLQVTIDDIPISTAPEGAADLSLLPVGLFDRVEVARGPLATSGSGASAGVVRLLTPERLENVSRLRLGLGSFGTTRVSGTAGGQTGSLSALLAAGRLASEGDYPYLDRKGTPWTPSDDETVRRLNNAFHQEDLLLRLRWDPTRDTRIETVGYGLWKDAGIPGTESLQTKRVHSRFRRWLQSLSVSADRILGVSWRLTGHLQLDRDRYRNPDGEVGLGRADTDNLLFARGMRAELRSDLPRSGLSTGVTGFLLSERWTPEDRLNDLEEPARVRRTRELAVDLRGLSPILSRLEVLLQQRWILTREALRDAAGVEVRRTIQAPRAGLALDAGRGLRLKAAWRSLARLPSFVELFGRGGIQAGNAELLPEEGSAWDLGAELRWPADQAQGRRLQLRIETVYFESATRNAIVWLQNSQRTARAWNLERTRVRGAEIVLQTAWHPGTRRPSIDSPAFSATLSYTAQDARDDGPTASYHGKLLPYQPRHHVSVETSVDAGRLRLSHRLDSESGFYRDRYNSDSQWRSPQSIHHLRASFWVVADRLDGSLSVGNLGDHRFQDVDGFPLPGRSFTFELTFLFPNRRQ